MSTTFNNPVHAEKVPHNLCKKRKYEELHDVVLIAGKEEKRIPVHRSVLSETSAYFKGMFTSSLRESTSKVVKIQYINGDILESLIEYCYKGSVFINEDSVIELFTTAHMLLLGEVVTACAKFLLEQLHSSNCLGFMLLAERYNSELLLQKSKEYALENYIDVCGTQEFLQLSTEQLSQLLASDELRVPTEEDAFSSLKTWLDHEPIEREQHKVELLKLLRMQFVEEAFSHAYIKPICTTIESKQTFMEALECHATPMKPRRSYEFLMATSGDALTNKLLVHYYCTQRQKWMKCRVELEYRSSFATVLFKNCLYLLGGRTAKGTVIRTVICLNLKTMTLNEVTPMIKRRDSCRAAVLNGCLYALGGFNGKRLQNSVEKYNPETNEWSKVAAMTFYRSHVGVAVLNKKLYVAGGWSNDENEALNTVECYDPVKDVWQSIASMGKQPILTQLMVSDGLLYAVGDAVYRKTIERYNPQTDEWTFLCDLWNRELFSNSCTMLQNKIVISADDHFEEYDAVTAEWKKLEFVKHPCINQIFSFTGNLLKSEFVEM